MVTDFSLTSLALSAGQVHGAIVGAAVRGAARYEGKLPPVEKALAQLQSAAKLPPQDYEQLSQIVNLAANKSGRPAQESLQEIRRIDEALRRKAEQMHPLLLVISGIANDSATTALSAPTPRQGGNGVPQQATKSMDVVTADVLGAVLGGIAGAKAGKDIESTLVGAVAGAILASSHVGSGKPFPGIMVIVE